MWVVQSAKRGQEAKARRPAPPQMITAGQPVGGRRCQPAPRWGRGAAEDCPGDGRQLQLLVGGQRLHTLTTFTHCREADPITPCGPSGPPSLTLSNPPASLWEWSRVLPTAPASLSHAGLTPHRPYQPPVPTAPNSWAPKGQPGGVEFQPPSPASPASPALSASPQGTVPEWPPAGPKVLRASWTFLSGFGVRFC